MIKITKTMQLFVGIFNMLFIGVNVIITSSLVIIFSLMKFLSPCLAIFWNKILVFISEQWIRQNNFILSLTTPINFKLSGDLDFDKNGNYLMISNHLSWVDVFALQYLSDKKKLPFLRFFIKKELIYVPFAGLAWWAMDFPMLSRYSKEYLKKHPEKRGQDLKKMINSCRKLKNIPSTITIFLEGTRKTDQKKIVLQSVYENLLNPKVGGLATAISVMGKDYSTIIDSTIIYPSGIPSFMDMLLGKIPEVKIHVKKREVPARFFNYNLIENSDCKKEFNDWINQIWKEKDETINSMKK